MQGFIQGGGGGTLPQNLQAPPLICMSTVLYSFHYFCSGLVLAKAPTTQNLRYNLEYYTIWLL